jgi:hypothetical protein
MNQAFASMTTMTRREQWRPVLQAEVKRWSAMPTQQLISELKDEQTYQVKFQSKEYNVEVQLLENTAKYIHVGVAVDDGSLPASFHPLSDSFIREK